MLSSIRIATCLAVVGSAAALAAAETRRVPSQFPTIQAAINAAVNGDTVLIADGVYAGAGNQDIAFLGKAITVRSEKGPGACIVDAGGTWEDPHVGFEFVNNEGPASVLEGLTVRNGYTFNGGGLFITSSPTIRGCVMTANHADCWGGGFYSQGGTPRVENCRFVGNESAAEGGGVFTISSNAVFMNCEISGNTGNLGAGICVFAGNPQFVNTLIARNLESSWAGGGYMSGGTLTNCTVVGNTADSQASGLYLTGSALVRNSIIHGNTGPGQQVLMNTATVTYSLVQQSPLPPGAGNLSGDPLFVNAAAGDYRLRPFSPVIDAGNNSLVTPGPVTTDLAGMPRFVNDPGMHDAGVGIASVVDIGAFEFQGVSCPCDQNGSGDVTLQDLFDFLAAFFSGGGDFNGNGATTTQDLFDFLGCWFAACE